MGYTMDPKAMYQMPVGFGPTPNMIQNLDDNGRRHLYGQLRHVTNHTLAYETNPEQLEKLLPERFTLDTPYVIMNHRMNRNLAWLAGRGYNLISVTIPSTFHGKSETIKGCYMAAIWENMCEPILAGREQLGYCKLYADISDVYMYNNVARTSGLFWDFPFVRMKFNMAEQPANLEEAKGILFDPTYAGDMNYKYIPKTGGGFNEADVEYFTLNPNAFHLPEDAKVDLPKPVTTFCTGSIQWFRPEYEDMPTQYHIVQALADLEVKRVVGAARVDAVNLFDCYECRPIG